MKIARRIEMAALLVLSALISPISAAEPEGTLRVRATENFEVTGDGSNAAWAKSEWVAMPLLTKEGAQHQTKFKLLYSPTGLYVLFDAADKTLTTTGRADFENLWEEDVFEFFLWTDEKHPIYFEYEISPLGNELPILVPNFGGKFLGWLPWHYEGTKKTRKATAVRGGKKEARATVAGWSAEIFMPFELLNPLQNVPPKSGTQWRANFYRMDYDDGKNTRWSWVPITRNFHDFEKFGKLIFE